MLWLPSCLDGTFAHGSPVTCCEEAEVTQRSQVGVFQFTFPDEVLADNYTHEEAFGRTPAIVCLQPHETLRQLLG